MTECHGLMAMAASLNLEQKQVPAFDGIPMFKDNPPSLLMDSDDLTDSVRTLKLHEGPRRSKRQRKLA